jgi:tetratricopeptide (TPR) repeat protein
MPPISRTTLAALVLLFAAVIGLQAMQARRQPLGLPADVTGNLLYVRSPDFLKRAALSYDALLADAYWIRAVQHYGGTKLTVGAQKQYDVLYPLLYLTTSLDPYFTIAYRFGAIFLAENQPGGAGRPDQAIALLQKGLRADPQNWHYAEDIGFVYYWWIHDYSMAAGWFTRAADIPGAPNWVRPLAAVTLAEGGNRQSSRTLWTEILNSADADWLRDQARFRLAQLDAIDQIDALERAVQVFRARTGRLADSWADLARAGILRGIPADPVGVRYELDPLTGKVTLGPDSSLNPLPAPDAPSRTTAAPVPPA